MLEHAPSILIATFFAVCFVFPLVRFRLGTGRWALVLRRRTDPREKGVLIGFFVVLGGVAAWAVLLPVVGPEKLSVWREIPEWRAALGALLGFAGAALVMVAQAQMGASWRIGIDDAPTELVVRGLFRFVRNPIYSGAGLASIALFVGSPSPWTLGGALLALVLMSVQARLEEEHLLEIHGDVFRAYASRVGRFVPGLGRLPGPSTRA